MKKCLPDERHLSHYTMIVKFQSPSVILSPLAIAFPVKISVPDTGLEGYLAGPQNTWDKTIEVAKREGNPKMYFSCGTKDFVMYNYFIKFREYAEKAGLDAEFIEVEGFNHEWRFWDICVQDAIEKFLPGNNKAGNAF